MRDIRRSQQMAQVLLAMRSFDHDMRAVIFIGIRQVEVEGQDSECIRVVVKMYGLKLFQTFLVTDVSDKAVEQAGLDVLNSAAQVFLGDYSNGRIGADSSYHTIGYY
jgi:hypothetical protein